MNPRDLDDDTPIEPDDELLATVHARSRAFRRRRTTQRLTSAMAGVVVIALAGGIAWTRVDTSGNRHITLPAATSTTSTTTEPAPSSVTQTTIAGPWRPASIAGYSGSLTDLSLAFDGYERWTGSDGCNELNGGYQLAENGIHFNPQVLSTLGSCGPTVPDFSQIEKAARSEIRDDQLTFLATDGSEIARFVRPDVTARIKLPTTTITAGSKVIGHVIIENNTGKVIDARGCGGLFAIALGNDTIHPDVAWTTCLQPLPIPVGETSYPVTFFASYLGCSTPAQGGRPACIPNGGTPPLPPGNYQAQFLQSSPVVVPAFPIDVTVVP